MTAAMQNVTNEKAPTMKCMQLFLTKFGERKKRQTKKSQNAGQLGRKRSRQITIGHKMSRVRIWTFCQTLYILSNSRNHETHTSRLHEAKSSCQAETETRTTRILPNSATNTAELRSQRDTTQAGTHYTHFGRRKRRKKDNKNKTTGSNLDRELQASIILGTIPENKKKNKKKKQSKRRP